ncbi:chitosanase [Pseudosporangium ferrugineum]|uniref:Chitosanase n=1 Tax=Pseudosporangium ferrugineum TaxID=439699 RepID=A0A2T0SDM8_9ACTN|nr:chitosanase [Pseudosporangium ferrugineum]PRY31522.1 chitosanase [Pseudosporangium ferrugineum]
MRAKVVALGVGIAAVCTVPLAITVTADAAPDVVLSRGHPVLASSAKDAARTGVMAVDGDPATRWTSGTPAITQWLRLDLGRAQAVTRVRLIWDGAYARAYRIQVSADGASWTDLHRETAGDGGTDDVKRLKGTGRYLRVLATQRAWASGYSLREIQVYGPGPAVKAIPVTSAPATVPAAARGLTDARKRELAFQLVSTAENSTLDWRGQYGYIEDIGDGRGYTAGIVGFCSGTSDMLALVSEYTRRSPRNRLAGYLPALRTVDGSDSHAGLDPGFTTAWKRAAADPVFQKTQEDERDRLYFGPAVTLASSDGLRALGQFAYYDAAVMHGMSGLRRIRAAAMRDVRTPKQGGDETLWLDEFLDVRVAEMRTEEAHTDVTRVETAQRAFLRAGNLDLNAPLAWRVYGDRFAVRK